MVSTQVISQVMNKTKADNRVPSSFPIEITTCVILVGLKVTGSFVGFLKTFFCRSEISYVGKQKISFRISFITEGLDTRCKQRVRHNM